MDDERFDDEVRQRSYEPRIVLKDGRTYTLKEIVKRAVDKSEIEETTLKDVLYRKLYNNPAVKEVSPEIERYLARKSQNRSRYQEVKFSVDGVPSTSPNFHKTLSKYGTVYAIK